MERQQQTTEVMVKGKEVYLIVFDHAADYCLPHVVTYDIELDAREALLHYRRRVQLF